MLALIHKAGDLGSISGSLSLVVTMILFIVPAFMFFVRSLTDKRPVMFAVHAFFLAFWTYVIVTNSAEYLESFKDVLSDQASTLACAMALILSALIWYLVIHFFFPRKN